MISLIIADDLTFYEEDFCEIFLDNFDAKVSFERLNSLLHFLILYLSSFQVYHSRKKSIVAKKKMRKKSCNNYFLWIANNR